MDVVDSTSLSYEEFCSRYMECNRPLLLRNVTNLWFPNTRKWHDGHKINFKYLREYYGSAQVPVTSGNEADLENRSTMKFADYLDMMESGTVGKRYLKDWHFVHSFGHDTYEYVGMKSPCGIGLVTPPFFKDDWLNWWWDHKENGGSDYRFVYLGPAGSWTPLHQDVFRSYSWSVNVCGRKKWIFFHPNDESKLKDRFGSVIPDITADDVDRKKYPQLDETTPMHVIQEMGEAVFVPSGWYHQVQNLDDTISINHNWFNGYNVRELWRFFKAELAAVNQELEDLKEIGLVGYAFDAKCQEVMLANTGINYLEFRELLYAKAGKLLKEIFFVESNSLLPMGNDQLRHLKYVQCILQELNAALRVLDESEEVEESWFDNELRLKSWLTDGCAPSR